MMVFAVFFCVECLQSLGQHDGLLIAKGVMSHVLCVRHTLGCVGHSTPPPRGQELSWGRHPWRACPAFCVCGTR